MKIIHDYQNRPYVTKFFDDAGVDIQVFGQVKQLVRPTKSPQAHTQKHEKAYFN